MLRAERGGDPMSGVLAALQGVQAGIYTAMPGIIQSFDPAKRTCVIQPAIKAQVQEPDGSFIWVTMPLLVDCPVIFPSGGGFTLTFPIAAGDETLVLFAQRCIDAWWQSSGVQVQAELRMHSISDGFALVGVNSVPRVIPNISTTNVQLRNDAGDAFVEITPGKDINVETSASINATAGASVAVSAGASATVEAPIVTVTGDDVSVTATDTIALTAPNINFGLAGSFVATSEMTITAPVINLNGQLIINGEPYLDHAHDDVTNGGDISGGVV